MARPKRAKTKGSRILVILMALPLSAIAAALLEWNLAAGVLAAAWLVAVLYYVGQGLAMDRKYGSWGSDHTLGP